MRWVANMLYLLAGVFYLPVLLYEMIVLGKNRRGWRERFGFVPRFDPTIKRIWVHAVSLGEMNATRELVRQLHERLPEVEVVFSTTTDTGFSRGVELYGRGNVFRFPLDLSFVVARVLRRVNPSLLVLIEQEVWYNLVRLAGGCGVSVVVVNGRLTERSAKRLALLGRIARSMFSRLTWIGAQDETIARRFAMLGTSSEKIEVTSSLKWDSAAVVDRVDGCDRLAAALGIDKRAPLWVCGSTGPGEEKLVLDAHRKLLAAFSQGVEESAGKTPVLAVIPRKPERFEEVARLIQSAGFDCHRRSHHADGVTPSVQNRPSVILGDTMGELRKFYCLADVVFVGRTLVPMGGSDPMEVAALGKPVIVGPHTDNFALPVCALREKNAIRQVSSANELAGAVESLFNDPHERRVMGERARSVVLKHQGATRRTVDVLVHILDGASECQVL